MSGAFCTWSVRGHSADENVSIFSSAGKYGCYRSSPHPRSLCYLTLHANNAPTERCSTEAGFVQENEPPVRHGGEVRLAAKPAYVALEMRD